MRLFFAAMSESRTDARVSGVLGFLVTRFALPEAPKTVIRISANVRNTHNQDGGIVLDVRHGRIFSLNFVGSRILELLKVNVQPPQIAEAISREFGVSMETANADVREFLESLEKHRLIERRDSGVAL
jgi:hypothetical protein